MHNPEIVRYKYFTAKKPSKTVINHFYEKLLKLASGYNMEKATGIAKGRASYIREFLDRFLKEWEGFK